MNKKKQTEKASRIENEKVLSTESGKYTKTVETFFNSLFNESKHTGRSWYRMIRESKEKPPPWLEIANAIRLVESTIAGGPNKVKIYLCLRWQGYWETTGCTAWREEYELRDDYVVSVFKTGSRRQSEYYRGMSQWTKQQNKNTEKTKTHIRKEYLAVLIILSPPMAGTQGEDK